MPETNLETKKTHVTTEEEPSLKGTFVFTMSVGVFIVASWSAIFFLFLNRL